MSPLYILKMNCKEATYLHEKNRENKLSFSEKAGLKLHLFFCTVCKLFFKQIDELEKCVHHTAQSSEKDILSPDTKLKMQRALDHEME